MAIRHKEGSNAIQSDTKKYVPAEIGDVVVSTAGSLPQKNIFHIITIDYMDIDYESIKGFLTKDDIYHYIIGHSIDRCFQLLHAMNMRSIAFPLIGGGTVGIPFDILASAMSEAIGRNLHKTKKAFDVEIYLFDQFGMIDHWYFLHIFEQFSAQVAISRLLNDHNSNKLSLEDESNHEISEDIPVSMDKDIFISYSRKDLDIVRYIYEWLEKAGMRCWLDIDGMFSGISFKKVIVNAIKQSKIVLFMSSESSNNSRNVVSEVSIAVKYNKKIIPVRLDSSSYSESIEYDILNYDYVVYDHSLPKESNKDILKKIISTFEMIEPKCK